VRKFSRDDLEPQARAAFDRLERERDELLPACLHASALLAAAALALERFLARAAPELVAKMAADFRAVEAMCDAAIEKATGEKI
jgi:hypothetical protein